MRVHLVAFALSFVWISTCIAATPDISGTWQGKDARDRQYVLKISEASAGTFRGEIFNLGETDLTLNGNPISSIKVEDKTVSFSLDRSLRPFDGRLSDDGKSIAGRFGPQSITFEKAIEQTEWVIDPSPHKTQFVTVDKDVKLEVLDWGGTGPPLIFLAGLGGSAHNFDSFALKFTDKHHVYGITRRGYGASDWPAPTVENYDPDRLGDDVLAVIDALKLDRPVIAGHSLAGEELSSIGTRHPEKVSGLVYLDSGYEYAFYDPKGQKSVFVSAADIQRDIRQLIGAGSQDTRALIKDIETMLPNLKQGLDLYYLYASAPPDTPTDFSTFPEQQIYEALWLSFRRYTHIEAPILAIFARPLACEPNCDTPANKAFEASMVDQVNAFEAGNPSARVVRLPYALHSIWRSNEADVLREMNSFMDGLPGH